MRRAGSLSHTLKWPYLFVSPYFFAYAVFGLFPILFSLYISFTNWSLVGVRQFVGLQNYVRIFTKDPFYFKSLGNTALFTALVIPLQLGAGLLLAVWIGNKWVRGKSALRLAIFSPYITTPVAIGILFAMIFDWNSGILNRLLLQLHLIAQPYDWMGHPATARLIVVLMLFWKYLGYNMMFYVAGITNISPEIYEAATVDGADGRQAFLRITVPLLKPITLFLLTGSIIGGLQLFEEPLLLFTGWASSQSLVGGPNNCCLTPIWYMYETSFGGSSLLYGKGSAIAYTTFMFIALFSFLGIRILGRDEESL